MAVVLILIYYKQITSIAFSIFAQKNIDFFAILYYNYIKDSYVIL